MTRFNIIGPDDLAITPEPFDSLPSLVEGFRAWLQIYREQGYYSAADGERIPVAGLAGRCRLEVAEDEPTADDAAMFIGGAMALARDIAESWETLQLWEVTGDQVLGKLTPFIEQRKAVWLDDAVAAPTKSKT